MMTHSSHLATLEKKLLDAAIDYELLIEWGGTKPELEAAVRYANSLKSQIDVIEEIIETEGAVEVSV